MALSLKMIRRLRMTVGGSSALVHLDSICRVDSIRKTSKLAALNGVLHVISQPSESHSENRT